MADEMILRQQFLIFCLILAEGFQAQPEQKKFAHYTTVEGLSHNSITGIAQDSTGYLWMSTPSGLNRFNGAQFVQFHSTNDSLSLASEEIAEMSWLDNYRLGAYTSAGLHIVDTRTGETRNLFVPYHRRNYLYKFNTIHGAKADKKGNIFILTRSGFYHFKDYQLVWRFDYYNESDLANTHFHFAGTLFWFDSTRLLIASINGFYLYDTRKRVLKKMEVADCPLMAEYLNARDTYRYLEIKAGSLIILKPDSDSLVYLNTIKNQKVISRLPFKPGFFDFHYRTRLVAVSDTLYYITGHNSG